MSPQVQLKPVPMQIPNFHVCLYCNNIMAETQGAYAQNAVTDKILMTMLKNQKVQEREIHVYDEIRVD